MSRKQKLRIGVVQIQSTADPYLNLALVQDFYHLAKEQDVDLLCFPENLFYRGPKKTSNHQRSDTLLERDENGSLKITHAFSETLKSFLDSSTLALSFGSVLESSGNPEKPFNSHWIVLPKSQIHSYKKIHLFNFSSSSGLYRESDDFSPGSESLVVEVQGWKVGLSICYDLRFAELFRNLVVHKGAELLLVPAAFTRHTGEVHWHPLLRARAIENLCYVAASGQWGSHEDSRGQKLFCFGHSMVVGPWGEIINEGPPEGDGLLVSELDAAELEQRRSQLPALQSARLLQAT